MQKGIRLGGSSEDEEVQEADGPMAAFLKASRNGAVQLADAQPRFRPRLGIDVRPSRPKRGLSPKFRRQCFNTSPSVGQEEREEEESQPATPAGEHLFVAPAAREGQSLAAPSAASASPAEPSPALAPTPAAPMPSPAVPTPVPAVSQPASNPPGRPAVSGSRQEPATDASHCLTVAAPGLEELLARLDREEAEAASSGQASSRGRGSGVRSRSPSVESLSKDEEEPRHAGGGASGSCDRAQRSDAPLTAARDVERSPAEGCSATCADAKGAVGRDAAGPSAPPASSASAEGREEPEGGVDGDGVPPELEELLARIDQEEEESRLLDITRRLQGRI